MKTTAFRKAALLGAAGLILCIFLFYWLVHDVWQYSVVDVPHAGMPLYAGENLLSGGEPRATVPAGLDRLDTITVWPHVQGEPDAAIDVTVSQNGMEKARRRLNAADFLEYEPFTVRIDAELDKTAETVLTFSTQARGEGEDALSFYCSKLDNGEGNPPTTLDYYGVRNRNLAFFWVTAGCLCLLYVAFCVWIDGCLRKNKKNFFIELFRELMQYSFLMSRLVARDFNTKYRQSALGVLWSVLNPLLTTLVMFIVFSQVFRSNTEHYIVYLLCGIVMWNYFADASSVGLESITINAPIINKVYVPRYIFPVSRCISSFVNLLISLIPMAVVCLFSGIRFTKALLLIPIPLTMLFIFVCGMSLLLATCHVFFRDTQFLWGVVRMMWTYLTPLFYTEDIIPARFIHLYHMNPMYQFIYFFRSLVLHGVSPQPIVYLYASLACLVPLALGIWVFRKYQRDFVLYL